MITNLTQNQIDKIQYDEGIAYKNFGETSETLLGPVRGGIEFSADASVRDIDYDGKKGKTKGMQVVDEQNAVLKLKILSCTQEDLSLALVGGVESTAEGKTVLKSGDNGLISLSKYLTNITVFTKTLDGKYKKITIFNALHETGFVFGAKPKSENEHNLEFQAHWDPLDNTKVIWMIEDIDTLPVAG